VNDRAPTTRGGPARTRRDVLRFAALGGAAVLLAACGPGYTEEPDVLVPLRDQALADAQAAGTVAAGGSAETAELARQVADVRSAHADALQAEIDRENRPAGEAAPAVGPSAEGLAGLRARLDAAREQAAGMVASLPRHRASLVGSVAAGCAAVQQLSGELGAGTKAATDPVPTGTLEPEAVEAMQRALATEHAAVWVYGLVSAFLPGAFTAGVGEGADEHRDRRDVCERALAASRVEPVPAEAAYVPPHPVTDKASAATIVAAAEADATEAWRGVLERTDDATLRTVALGALIGSAARGTAWRAEAGLNPAAVALPGRGTAS